jgi:hypothetical protein
MVCIWHHAHLEALDLNDFCSNLEMMEVFSLCGGVSD